MSSSSRTHNSKPQQQGQSAQWLESREARLNPPMADDEPVFDPFEDLPDGDAGQVDKLRLMFNWKPRAGQMH